MSGVVFGCIAPHPPLLYPGVGRGQEDAVRATAAAMAELADRLAQSRPQSILIVSPHGHSHPEAMGILTAPSSTGDMSQWGARGPQLHFVSDPDLVKLIQRQAKIAGVPLRSIGEKSYALDHGVMVPMGFLAGAVKGLPMVPLTFSWLPLSHHIEFGRAIGRAAAESSRRVAIIASGDLSHRLTPQAPAGYDPIGKTFDQKLVDALRRFDANAAMSLDPDIVDRAGECGYRSIAILLGALEGLSVEPEILCYEGPFGVGYLTASFVVHAA